MSSSNVSFDFRVGFEPPVNFLDDLVDSNIVYTEADLADNKNSFMVLVSTQDKFGFICQRISNNENYDKQYSFSNMFNNEFLADIKLKASNGQIFYAHKSILLLTLKDNTDTFLKKMNQYSYDSDLIELMLYYFYCDCLPAKFDLKLNSNMERSKTGQEIVIEENKIQSFIDFINNFAELKHLNTLLQSYLNNFSFKLKSDKLINEIKKCCETINSQFKYDELNPIRQHLFTNPTKLCQVIKSSFEQLYLAFLKCIRLLDMYSSRQEQLSKDEKLEFIKKIKNSLPFFLDQLQKFLKSIHKQSLQLNEGNRREIADYMVTEIDNFVNYSLELTKYSEEVIEKIVNNKKTTNNNNNSRASASAKSTKEASKNGKSSNSDSDDIDSSSEDEKQAKSSNTAKNKTLKSKVKYKLGKSFKNAIHIRELNKIQKFSEKCKKNFQQLEDNLQKYQKTNQNAKPNLVFKELNTFIDNIINDVPNISKKLDNYSVDKKIQLNKVLKLNDFKFAFKLISTKTQWFLTQLRTNKQIVNPFINDLCSKLQNNDLNVELEKLDLGPSNLVSESNSTASNSQENSNCDLDSFFKSKSANNSRLAREAIHLYKSKNLADISLEIHDDETKEVKLIKIHGALIASRCTWFQRALSSGMQEAINRKVILHDSNLKLFEKFIEYLYTGSLNDDHELEKSNLTNDELIELLTLGDKYECDSLRNLIEIKFLIYVKNQSEIIKHDKNESNLSILLVDYLNLSDQFKLNVLMDFCITIIAENFQDQTLNPDMDEFKQIPKYFLTKISEKLTLIEKRQATSSKEKKTRKNRNYKINDLYEDDSIEDDVIYHDTNNNSNIVDLNMDNLMLETNTRLQQLLNYAHPLIVVDARLLEDSFVQLKEILGTDESQMNDEQLVKLLIRNDFDLNRVIPIVLNCE